MARPASTYLPESCSVLAFARRFIQSWCLFPCLEQKAKGLKFCNLPPSNWKVWEVFLANLVHFQRKSHYLECRMTQTNAAEFYCHSCTPVSAESPNNFLCKLLSWQLQLLYTQQFSSVFLPSTCEITSALVSAHDLSFCTTHSKILHILKFLCDHKCAIV